MVVVPAIVFELFYSFFYAFIRLDKILFTFTQFSQRMASFWTAFELFTLLLCTLQALFTHALLTQKSFATLALQRLLANIFALHAKQLLNGINLIVPKF